MGSESHDTVWTVLRAASRGDASARAAFAQGYAVPIRSYLQHRWRGRALAASVDDAVHDVFVECYKPGGVLERADPERGGFRPLLYGVVRNIARRHEELAARSGARAPGESVHLDELPHQAEALSRTFDRAWARSLLREAVQRHEAAAAAGDDDARLRLRILRMRHEQGMPVRTIAAALGEADVAVVHNAYRRARRDFAVHLRAVVAASTGVQGPAVDDECRRLTELLQS
ncbi:MAG: sigma-70 family RNA polymerase sigma factor [Planctomycetes bacterium]|nr:sigma-70 family RNA polymerase sigma factor [Planctomycetota bacterium]